MTTPQHDVTGTEPDLSVCKTERIANNLSRCLANNSTCEYALAAGPRTICMHENRRDFEYSAVTPPPWKNASY